MKRAWFVFFLLLLSSAGGSADPIGAIKQFSGVIGIIKVEDKSLEISGMYYDVDAASALIVDGQKVHINDLSVGMKVEGTSVITARQRGGGGVIRKLTVIAPDTNAPPAPADAGVSRTPAPQDGRQDLTGTFWMLANEKNPQVQNWFSLNADGTTTCSWTSEPGRWSRMGIYGVSASFGASAMATIRFELNLSQGEVFGTNAADATISITKVATPTQAMLDKVPQNARVAAVPSPSPAEGGAAPVAGSVSPEQQAAAAEAVRANHANLVFVTGKAGAGSGFIANMGNGTFLVTNAHVAAGISDAGFKTLNGEAVTGGAPSVAVGHDIFCMAMPAGTGKPLEVMRGVDENAKIGDDVVVLGNAEGSGVINTILGKIVGIGPDLVEIDAQFVPGNSGSPIIHLKSGKVIGVATYLVVKKYDAATHAKMAQPEIHRYGYRLDSVKTWQPVDWRSFYAQADTMEKIHGLTDDLDGFFQDIAEHKGHVTMERHTNPVIKNRIAQWAEDKQGHKSAFDLENADANFLSFLKVACQSDINAAQNRMTYDYFQRELTDEQQIRTEMAKAFADIIKGIRE